MLTLGFDTSTDIGAIGLVDGDRVKGEYIFEAGESQSEKLLTSIDLLLDGVNLGIEEVDKIAVSRGPGSFTGLRIGISTAKGLSHGLNVPLVGIPLTTCYFSRVKYYPGSVCTLIKDRRNLVYLAGFDGHGEKVIEEKSLAIEELEETITVQLGAEDSSRPVLLVGDGVSSHREQLYSFDNTLLAEGELNYPSGAQVALLGEELGEGKDELTSLEPLYAQRPIAEINFDKQNKR